MSNVESNDAGSTISISQEIAGPVSLQFDPNRYRADLDDLDISEAQKTELMAVLWDIMCRFVELGFSVDVCSALLGDDEGDDETIPSDGDLE